MNGYVMNTSAGWMHVMKRTVGPGRKILLDDLYEQYGEKHGLEKGDAFVNWLKTVKIKDASIWKVIYGEDIEESHEDVVSEIQTYDERDIKSSQSINKMTVQEVVMLSVRQGREELPKITDLKLLKYAFQEANQLTGKDSLCNVIRKRIKDLELGR